MNFDPIGAPNFTIDSDTRRRVAEVVAFARNHPQTLEMMAERRKRLIRGEKVAAGAVDPRRTVELPRGMSLAFAIDEHIFGMTKHLAITLSQDADLPSLQAIDALCEEFGFFNDFETNEPFGSWCDRRHDGRIVVNILEPMDGDWENAIERFAARVGNA